MTTKIKSRAATSVVAAALLALLGVVSPANALNLTNLKLINGWHYYGYNTRFPTAAIDKSGVIHLRGAMYQPTGTDAHAFTLPLNLRPNGVVYIPIDLNGANPGRIFILPTGAVYIVATGAYANAQAFTSLEGVTFPTN
jgi:hypothetical protein